MTARSIHSRQNRKTRPSTGDYVSASGGATPNEDNDHEARSCDGIIGDGLRRRIDVRLCPGRWTWRIWAWRLWSHGWRAQSVDAAGIAGTDDADVSKPHSGPASGPCASARRQWAVGAQPVRRRHVGAPALSVSTRGR
jgi:hypothetical protein